MKKLIITEEQRNNVSSLIGEGIFPNLKMSQINQVLNMFFNLPELVEEKKPPKKDKTES